MGERESSTGPSRSRGSGEKVTFEIVHGPPLVLNRLFASTRCQYLIAPLDLFYWNRIRDAQAVQYPSRFFAGSEGGYQ